MLAKGIFAVFWTGFLYSIAMYVARVVKENMRYAREVQRAIENEQHARDTYAPTEISSKPITGNCPRCGAPINPHKARCEYCDCYYK